MTQITIQTKMDYLFAGQFAWICEQSNIVSLFECEIFFSEYRLCQRRLCVCRRYGLRLSLYFLSIRVYLRYACQLFGSIYDMHVNALHSWQRMISLYQNFARLLFFMMQRIGELFHDGTSNSVEKM